MAVDAEKTIEKAFNVMLVVERIPAKLKHAMFDE